MKTMRRISRLSLCIVHCAFCIALVASALAEDHVLTGALQTTWTEMGPCPSVRSIIFPMEANSCGGWAGNFSCTSSFVRVESDNLYSAIFQWYDGTYIKHVKINFKCEDGRLYAKGVRAGYLKTGAESYPYDFDNKSFTAQTYATTLTGNGYGLKELTAHVLSNGIRVMADPEGFGDANPGFGTVALEPGASLPVSAPAVWTNAAGDTAATCTGWKLYGEDDEVVSNGTECAFTYLHPASGGFRSLEWQWAVEYKVTATAGDGGGVTPAEQWVAHGGSATVLATTNAAYAFGRWTGDMPKSAWYDNPARFAVAAPCEVVAIFVPSGAIPSYAYRFIGNGVSYGTASGWENERVPPGDVEADDIYVASGAGGNVSSIRPFRSLTFEPPMTATFSVWSYSNCRIGAGGVTATDMKGGYIYGYKTIDMPCSQRWLLDGETSGDGYRCYAGMSLAEGAVWTACGRRTLNFNNAGSPNTSLGRLRTNMTLNFSTVNSLYNLPTNVLYWTNNELDGGPVRTNALGQPNISISMPHAGSPDIGLPPIEWDFTNPNGTWKAGYSLSFSENARGVHLRCGAWSGAINDGVLRIDYNVAKDYCNPFRSSRMVLADAGTLDSSTRPCIWWKRGMLEIGDDNAFGVSNRLSLLIGHGGGAQDAQIGGVAAGIVAAPGVTVASDICVTNADVYHTLGRQVWLGAMDAGAPAVFTGDVENNDAMLSRVLMYARCPSQIRLFSGRGAEAQFTGSFSGSALLPMEIHGWGATRLSGDNSGLKAGVSVRSGTLKVAADNALGHHPVTLGGTVPDVIDVEYCSYSNITFKSGSPLIVDGCVVQPGERVLTVSRVYKLADDGSSFAADPTVSTKDYGLRVNIAKGAEYAGTAFESVHSFNNGCAFVEEPPEPSAALLADGSRVITNDVAVTDNLSSGTSAIGGCTADTSVFSGKITLHRGVTFHAAPGGVVRFTGSVADAGETINPFAFTGTGTVALPAGTDMNGRPVSFPGLTDEVLDATGQTSCTLVTAAGGLTTAEIAAPSLAKWQFRVKATSIRAVKNAKTVLFVQ